MRILIKIIRILIALILCVVLAFNGWMIYQRVVLKREAPEIFGYSQYIVATGSMEPTLPVGAVILVKEQEDYGLLDVVTFVSSDGGVITHRIVGQVEGKFITRGDANNTEDPELLPPENILGKVQTIVGGTPAAAKAIGQTLLFLRTPFGILALLAVGVLLIKLPDWAGVLKTKAEGKHAQQ